MQLSPLGNSLQSESSVPKERPEQSRSPFRKSVRKLKRVSGRLRQLLHRTEQPTHTPAHLLVVDDEESIRFSLSDYFAQKGFEVDTAQEVEEAERLIEKTAYEVIIQDLRLSSNLRHEGLDVIKFVHQRNPETRVVVLTAYGTPEVENEAFRSGAAAFLKKPKPLSQVAQVVQGLIRSPH
ncbi:MAG TPA: response regulator [Pyrinomonadaceae bacterium]|nr:response regulator [Pyrinomonadaceae bacterium]